MGAGRKAEARKVVEVAPFGPRLENRRATGRANTSNRDTKSSSTSSSLLGGRRTCRPLFLPLLIIADLIFKSVRMIFDYQVYECELLMTNEIWYNVNRKD